MDGITNAKLKKLLGKRTKTDLVNWIVEQASLCDDLRRAVLEFVAPDADAKTLASELRKIITKAWRRIRTSREPWKLARPISEDLSPVLVGAEQLIDRGHAVEAEGLLRRLIEAADKGLDHVDDSYGYLGPPCQDAVTLWGKAWAKIEPRDHAKLAKMIFDQVQDDGYGLRDKMIHDFAAALGHEGLLTLKHMFLTQYESMRLDKGLDEFKRQEPLRHMADVADALGDVDLYIDAQKKSDLLGIYAMPIARRLLDVGRAEEALEALNRGDSTRSHFRGEQDDYTTLKCKILQTLGRDEEAKDTLWRKFQQTLARKALDRLLALTPKEQRSELAEDALAVAEKHANRPTAALFLMDRGHVNRAAAVIVAHPDAFNGRFYETLLKLAEPLSQSHPAAAWVLYRALLLEILESRRTKAYHHGVDYLDIMENLATRADLAEKQRELLICLREKHGRKYSFWNLVNE